MRKHFFDKLEDCEIGELLHEYGLIQAAKGDVDKLRSLEFSRGGDKVGFVALTGGAEPWCEVRAFTTDLEDPVTGCLNGALAQWLLSLIHISEPT